MGAMQMVIRTPVDHPVVESAIIGREDQSTQIGDYEFCIP